MSKKKNRTYSRSSTAGLKRDKNKSAYYYAALFFALWALIVPPLWLEDQYFNLREAKGHSFLAGAFLTLVILITAIIDDKSVRPLLPHKKLTDWAIVVFGVFGAISSCCSGFFTESFFGSRGWWVGGFQMIVFAVMIMVMTEYLEWSLLLRNALLTIGFIVFGIGVIHNMGIDFLGLHKHMAEGTEYAYVSTIGNINWFVGFICITVPVVAVLFMRSDEKLMDRVYGIYMFLACLSIVLCRSDGVFIGIGVCAFFMIPFVLSDEKHFRRFMLIVSFYGISTLMILVLPMFSGAKSSVNGLGAVFAKPTVAAVITAVGIAGYFASRLYGRISAKAIRITVWALELILAAAVVYFVIDSVRSFNDQWGTGRGMIWAGTVKQFAELSPLRKLIGTGPETLFYYNQELSERFGMLVLANHSDFMQLLPTTGIIGIGAWLCMWIGLIADFIKNGSTDEKAFPFFAAVAAYLGQSTVNTMESMVFPMLAVMIALYLHTSRNERKPDKTEGWI